MTKLLANPTIYQQSGDLGQSAGTAPNGAQMTGNPSDTASRQNMGVYPPGPQVGSSAQTVNSPLSHDQISRGNVPLNSVPSNLVNQQPGTQSLLALIASGQVSLNQSNYGQPVTVPPNGAGGQASVVPSAEPQPQAAGIASTITVGTSQQYVGD